MTHTHLINTNERLKGISVYYFENLNQERMYNPLSESAVL